VKGQKTGGRVEGTPNRDTSLIAEFKARYVGYNPLIALVEIANNTDNNLLQYHCHKEVAKYILPQLRSIKIEDNYNKITVRLIKVKKVET
jgi:hypothetical protein